MNQSFAYLELILGPMFSKKTSRLIDIHKQCEYCNIPTLSLNHSFDTRYSKKQLSSHDKIMIPCHFINKNIIHYENIMEEYQNAQVILINEGQFFPDLVEMVEKMLKDGKKIYVCGLDGDFKQKKFGQILDLIPLCDKVTKLTSLCGKCKDGTAAIFSMRITNENEQTVIGSDNYIPVCRKCNFNN